MRLRFQQLEGHLAKRLVPVYVVAGEEPWQATRAADAIRAAARVQGYTERAVFHVEQGFDWSELQGAARSLSLFAERRILDVRLPAGKPGQEGAKALANYAAAPPADALLLLQLGRLERAISAAAWFKALDKAGVVVQVWPLSLEETRAWIHSRMRERGLTADAPAIELLTTRVEGNLLAAAQEIDKLSLQYGAANLDQQAMADAASHNARHDIFDLAEAALAGETLRAIRILSGLRAEATPDTLILWVLTDQLRTLATMAQGLREGNSLAEVSQHVWQRRRRLVQEALKRHRHSDLGVLLRRCARVDRVIKGRAPGSPRDELLQLVAMIAGPSPMMAAGDATIDETMI